MPSIVLPWYTHLACACFRGGAGSVQSTGGCAQQEQTKANTPKAREALSPA